MADAPRVPIAAAKTLLLHSRGAYQEFLTSGPDYYPTAVVFDEPPRRGVYVSGMGNFEQQVDLARNRLDQISNPLLAFLRYDPGGAVVTSRLFVYAGQETVSIADNLSNRQVTKYVAPHRAGGHSIFGDAQAGTPGFFLTGALTKASLWRVLRVEIDAFDSAILTLRAVQPLGDMPQLIVSNLPGGTVGIEIQEHYRELQAAVGAYSIRAVVTHARSIIEPIIAHLLEKAGLERGRDLGGHLKNVKEERERAGVELAWLSDLAYHQAHRVRLLHARTHPDRASQKGQSLAPEMAFSCIEDLKQILLEAGLAQ